MTGVTEKHDSEELRTLIAAHVEATGSVRGREILDKFGEYLPKFKKIIPIDYQKMMVTIGQLEERGIPHEEAKLQAFYRIQKA